MDSPSLTRLLQKIHLRLFSLERINTKPKNWKTSRADWMSNLAQEADHAECFWERVHTWLMCFLLILSSELWLENKFTLSSNLMLFHFFSTLNCIRIWKYFYGSLRSRLQTLDDSLDIWKILYLLNSFFKWHLKINMKMCNTYNNHLDSSKLRLSLELQRK